MRPNELDVFYVMDTETTGLSTENADVIQVSAIKVKNNKGEYEVLNIFDTFINPGYPLPPEIVEFNKNENTGIDDELLSKAPSASEAAKMLKEFLGDAPTVVLHNAPFDTKFINKLYNNQLGQDFQTSGTVDTLELCKIKLDNEPKHKLGIMYGLTEKKFSKIYFGSKEPKFHTALADAYATLDVLDYLKNRFYKPNTIKVSKNKMDTIKKLERTVREIQRPEYLPSVICSKDINGIAVGLDNNYAINGNHINFSFPNEDKDLSEYINWLIREKKENAFLISRKDRKNGELATYEITGYVNNGKGEIYPIGFECIEEPRCKDEYYDVMMLISSTIQEMKEYNRTMLEKKERKTKDRDR